MSTRTLPRYVLSTLGNLCWVEHAGGARHCTLPVGHSGKHYHAYTKTQW